MIRDTITYLKPWEEIITMQSIGLTATRVIGPCLKTILPLSGADVIVLCDTNGV